jgi:hypothetical protein
MVSDALLAGIWWIAYRAGVDGEAVILVLNVGTRDCDASAIADVKSICVMAQAVGIARRIANSDTMKGEAIGAVNGEGMHRRVLYVEISDGRSGEWVGVEEFRLRSAAVAAFSVSLSGPSVIEHMASWASDGDISSGDQK